MTDSLVIAAETLLKREQPQLVAAMGLIFQRLYEIAEQSSIERALESYRGGIWGKETTAGSGYPVLRSTNMRGVRVDVAEPAWCDISSSQAESCALKTGDILVIKSSGSNDLVGKAALFIHPQNNNTYVFSNFVMRLRANKNIVLSDFLAWFLRSPQSLMWRYKTQQNAVGLRNLDTKAFLEQSIPLPSLDIQQTIIRYLYTLEEGKMAVSDLEIPPSLNEQHRIVARIEELAAKFEEARELRREAVEEAEKLIGLAVSDCFEKGVENGWIVRQLGNYVVSDCYGTSEKTTDDDSGIPILRMGNIQNGHIDLNDLKYLHLSDREKTKLLLAEGDILVNRTNSAELVGKCAVFDLEGDYGFASYLIRLRLDSSRAEPRLIAMYINSPAGRNYMFNERKQMTGQANVNATKLKALPIALPSLSEQHRIVTYLNSLQSRVNSLKQLQSETSVELNALLPSILDKAFKGDL